MGYGEFTARCTSYKRALTKMREAMAELDSLRDGVETGREAKRLDHAQTAAVDAIVETQEAYDRFLEEEKTDLRSKPAGGGEDAAVPLLPEDSMRSAPRH